LPIPTGFITFAATIDIGTLAVLEGQLPALNLVQEWAMIIQRSCGGLAALP
jgi:hypothetical protein